MKKYFLIPFLLLFTQSVQSQLPSSTHSKHHLTVAFNTNVELLGFAYFIGFEGTNSDTQWMEINGKKILEKDWQNYGYDFYQRYKRFSGSENLIRALTVADHLWLDAIIPLLLEVPDFPAAKLTEGISDHLILPFSVKKDKKEAIRNVEIFLEACNRFYTEVNFQQYLEQCSKYYDAALNQINKHLPDLAFIKAAESFYRQQFHHYYLVPSLTIPKGMGFGPRKTKDGRTTVYNVFGAVDYQVFKDMPHPDMGFGNESKLRELSVHEFGHSFVNPEMSKLTAESFKRSASLFKPLQQAMNDQGYNTWPACVTEHFVRAGEIAIARRMRDKKTAKRLMEEYVGEKKFVYIPQILVAIKQYEKNKNETYLDMAKRVMEQWVNDVQAGAEKNQH